MRHYYRFMELEPVLEQEEDSVGEASPTSSMGSPSFSPPPDAWTQISGKDYHDPLSSHLLQEHLDLQRAYRLLEVQLQTRASRDLQKTRDVLPAQERLREELQRAKEREAALRGEIYDLHEQNELLEFRILELEECQENASTRGGPPESRDVATETDDVTDAVRTSLPVVEEETQRIQERLRDESGAEVGSATEGCETRLTADIQDHSSALTNTLDPDQRGQGHEDDVSHPLSEGISCTLCRRLPRRRSFPEPSPPTSEPLKKSKSEGEIVARRMEEGQVSRCVGTHVEVKEQGVQVDTATPRIPVVRGGVEENKGQVNRCVGTHVEVKEQGVQVAVAAPRSHLFSGGVEDQVRTMRAMLTSIYEVIMETRVEVECTNSELREEVQTLESTVQRLKEEAARGLGAGEGPLGPPPVRRSRSLSFSKECYCCSQDLQPNLEEVITKLQQVMSLVTDPGVNTTFDLQKTHEEDDEEIPDTDKEEDPEEPEGTSSPKQESRGDAGKEPRWEDEKETNPVQKPRSEDTSGISEAMPGWKTESRPQIQTKETLSPPPAKRPPPNVVTAPKQVANENRASKLDQGQWTADSRADEYDQTRRSFSSQELPKAPETWKPEVMPKRVDLTTNIPPLRGVVGADFADPRDRFREYDACVVKGTDEAIRHLEELTPLPEEKSKPVLRRWREQLLVRRDRVQPWRIEMLDFPKRLPSVV